MSKKVLDVTVTLEGNEKIVTVRDVPSEDLMWYGGTPVEGDQNSRAIQPGQWLSVWSKNGKEYSEITTINFNGETPTERADNIRKAAQQTGIRVGI